MPNFIMMFKHRALQLKNPPNFSLCNFFVMHICSETKSLSFPQSLSSAWKRRRVQKLNFHRWTLQNFKTFVLEKRTRTEWEEVGDNWKLIWFVPKHQKDACTGRTYINGGFFVKIVKGKLMRGMKQCIFEPLLENLKAKCLWYSNSCWVFFHFHKTVFACMLEQSFSLPCFS